MGNKTPVKAVIDVVNIDKFKSFSIPVFEKNSGYLGKKVGNILASLKPLRSASETISITCDNYGATLQQDGYVYYDASKTRSWREKLIDEMSILQATQMDRLDNGKLKSKHLQKQIAIIKQEVELYRDIWM